MRFGTVVAAGVILLALFGQLQFASAAKPTEAESVLANAAKQNRYTFVTFFHGTDDITAKMIREVKAEVQGKLSDRAGFISVDAGSPANEELVTQYGVDRASLPLTVVVAPNGALTAGYPETIPSEVLKADFRDVFVSKGMADVLKALQSGKLAAVCFQNSKTKYNKESLAAAKGLGKDKNFKGSVIAVLINPTDGAESKLLKMCSVNADTSEATLVVIAPPGTIVGTFPGATTKDDVVAALTSALGGGCSGGGCGPGGCG